MGPTNKNQKMKSRNHFIFIQTASKPSDSFNSDRDLPTRIQTSVHSAGCECGFSVQNRILTRFRHSLTIEMPKKDS